MKGLFYGIGHQPNSQLVAGQVDLDDHGYVKVLAYVKDALHQAMHNVKHALHQAMHCVKHALYQAMHCVKHALYQAMYCVNHARYQAMHYVKYALFATVQLAQIVPMLCAAC